VIGKWQCTLAPGTYTFSWRISLPQDEPIMGPMSFGFEATGNEQVNTICYFDGQSVRASATDPQQGRPLGYRWDGAPWIELDVGEFTVESEDLPVEIDFHLKEVNCSRTKSHLSIDCVSIRPSFTVQERHVIGEEISHIQKTGPNIERTGQSLGRRFFHPSKSRRGI
jgi:hypothetical protein